MVQKAIKVSGITVLIGITVLSLLPPEHGVELHSGDKTGHFLAYMVLTINWLILAKTRQRSFLVFSGTLTYGIFMEMLQLLVPGRDASVADILANALGSGIGWLLVGAFRAYRKA